MRSLGATASHEHEAEGEEGGRDGTTSKSHFWKIGKYRLGICRTMSAIEVAYAPPA